MAKQRRSSSARGGPSDKGREDGPPGKRTLTAQLERSPGGREPDPERMHRAAEHGVSGGGTALPHQEAIQRSFGRHDVSGVKAHVGGQAAAATRELGAEAYASGESVAFSRSPSLHTAAHEAAHVVQQRGGVQLKGGVGEAGDPYEQHADAVADRVVSGGSAEALLDQKAPAGGSGGGVQRLQLKIKDDLREAIEGWGTDEDAIFTRLSNASPSELWVVISDDQLMADLRSDLGDGEMKRVLDLLDAPLAMKLRYAMEGWGTDEDYIHTLLGNASIGDIAAVLTDEALRAQLESELSGGDLLAVTARLKSVESLMPVLDQLIDPSTPVAVAKQAFELYWDVDLSTAQSTDSSGTVHNPSNWNSDTLSAVHEQLKVLPVQDTRAGVWSLLVRVANQGGATMSSSGRFGLGENAENTPDQPYGVGTALTAAAAKNSKELRVEDTGRFEAGATVAIDRGEANGEVHKIASVDAGNKKYVLEEKLDHDHNKGAYVTPDDASAIQDVSWLGAVVRHEIAHAVDTAVGGVQGFTQGLGGWWQSQSFDTWAAEMGSPWSTNDGSEISDEDKDKIKTRIIQAMNSNGVPLRQGMAADHPIVTNYNKDVPVIEAAKTAEQGKSFWQNPTTVPGYSGNRFAINCYYHRFQYYKEQVHQNRVRDYSIFSPAEFFAEVYTVFYEEAGQVPDEQLGQRVPVSSWREWIRRNIHERGHSPSEAQAAGNTSPAVGMKANDPGE